MSEKLTISLGNPEVIIAGIKQFGLAADGSDLRDLFAAFERMRGQIENAGRLVEEAVKKAREDHYRAFR